MRLTVTQISCVRDSVAKHFGDTSHVWLFGSRVGEMVN